MNDDARQSDASRRLRRQMIADQIEPRGVHGPRVLSAIESIPREVFVPADARSLAYEDRALSIEENQTISQPYIVAYMTDALGIEPHHRILEVGTGSGYQTAILSRLADRVVTIERFESLSRAAADRLASLGIANVMFHVGDGSNGCPEQAPFDRIIVTAASPSIPQPLVDQLAIRGRLIIPVGDGDSQTLILLSRLPGRTRERPLIPCRFVKLVGQHGWSG